MNGPRGYPDNPDCYVPVLPEKYSTAYGELPYATKTTTQTL